MFFLVLATSRLSLVDNHCCCHHLQTAISDGFPASASSRSGSGKTAPDKSGDLSLDRLVRTFPHCHYSSSSLFPFPHFHPFSLNPSFSLFLLSSDSYLPANWALRRQQREDIEEDEYVTVSCWRGGSQVGGPIWYWVTTVGGDGIEVRSPRGIGGWYGKRYATPVPIVPYNCDPCSAQTAHPYPKIIVMIMQMVIELGSQ